jgi:hypothetical protein
MSLGSEVERALLQALACRDDRKRGELTLEALRRKENEAIDHLQELVRKSTIAPRHELKPKGDQRMSPGNPAPC